MQLCVWSLFFAAGAWLLQLALPRMLARRWHSPAVESAWTADLCGIFAGTSRAWVKDGLCRALVFVQCESAMFICTQVAALRARDAALQQALAERNIDNVELRRQLAAARQAADPHVAQARLPAACIHLRRLICIALAAA